MSKEILGKKIFLLNVLLGTSQVCFADFDQKLALEAHRNNPITFPTYRVERKAFQGHTANQVNIPEGVTFIDKLAFANCPNLTSVAFSSTLQDIEAAFVNDTKIVNVDLSSAPNLQAVVGSFKGCSSLQSIQLPDNLETIGDRCFEGCSNLSGRLQLPTKLKFIGEHAFHGCTNLSELEASEHLKYVAPTAFEDCDHLQSLIIPTSVPLPRLSSIKSLRTMLFKEPEIKEGAFRISDFPAVTSIVLSDEVKNISSQPFHGSISPLEITLPETLQSIQGDPIPDSYRLTLRIPASLTETTEIWDKCQSTHELKIFADKQSSTCRGPFADFSSLIPVELENGMTEIAPMAFQNSVGLSVTLPETLEKIGTNAFTNAHSLEITFPTSWLKEGEEEGSTRKIDAFLNARKLTVYATDTDKNCSDDFSAFPQLRSITLKPGFESIGDQTFQNLSHCFVILPTDFTGNTDILSKFAGIKTLTITPTDSKKNCGGGFSSVTNLEKVILQKDITSIDANAFQNCGTLKAIDMSDSITSIGEQAFNECPYLESVHFSETLENIGANAFQNCLALSNIDFPPSVTTIGQYAFSGTGLEYAEVPDTITSTGRSVFESCPNLRSAKFSNAITAMNEAIFYNCPQLTSIQFPDHLQSLGAHACRATGIKEIKLPETLQTVGAEAFHDCTKLRSIDFSKTAVTAIGDSAFLNCTALSELTLPKTLTSIGSKAFRGCKSLTSIVFPDSLRRIGPGAYYPSGSFNGCSNLRTVVLPKFLTSIGGGAFYYCSNLTDVVFPETLEAINGHCAFEGCHQLKTHRPSGFCEYFGLSRILQLCQFGICCLTGIFNDNRRRSLSRLSKINNG